MSQLKALMLLASLPTAFSQQYELVQEYTPANFFDEFRFFTDQDPTGGFVQYVPFETAAATGLIGNTSGLIYLGVDKSKIYPAGGLGRPSVRLESKLAFTEGLFVLDLSHMPAGCGAWPAFWTVGLSDWPADGEIDIIENVNDATENNAALHAAGTCDVSAAADQTAIWKSTNCNIVHDRNQGCGSRFVEPNNYGEAFNLNGGGVYAMEWTSSAVNIWFFPPTAIPESLLSPSSHISSYSHPETSQFGRPSVSFVGPCSASFGDKFFNHTLILDTTFCGGWAGGTFGMDGSKCLAAAGKSSLESCIDFVGNNPWAFSEAYWSIKSLKVWQKVPGYSTQSYANETTAIPDAVKTQKPGIYIDPMIDPAAGTLVPVSPLTGGVLKSENPFIDIPVPMDPGIGDSTFPDTFSSGPDNPIPIETGIGDVSGPEVFETTPETEVPGFASTGPTDRLPQAATSNGNSGMTPPVLNGNLPFPGSSSIWGSLDGKTQEQLLSLASSLTETPSPEISPQLPVTVQDPILPSLNNQDTSQAVGGILSLLDQSAKDKLLNLVSPVAPIAPPTKRQLGEAIGANNWNFDTLTTEYPEQALDIPEFDSDELVKLPQDAEALPNGTWSDLVSNLEDKTQEKLAKLLQGLASESSLGPSIGKFNNILKIFTANWGTFEDDEKAKILTWLTDSEVISIDHESSGDISIGLILSLYEKLSDLKIEPPNSKSIEIETTNQTTSGIEILAASPTEATFTLKSLEPTANSLKNFFTSLDPETKAGLIGLLAPESTSQETQRRVSNQNQAQNHKYEARDHSPEDIFISELQAFIEAYHTLGTSLKDFDPTEIPYILAAYLDPTLDVDLDAPYHGAKPGSKKDFKNKLKIFVGQFLQFIELYNMVLSGADKALIAKLLVDETVTPDVRLRARSGASHGGDDAPALDEHDVADFVAKLATLGESTVTLIDEERAHLFAGFIDGAVEFENPSKIKGFEDKVKAYVWKYHVLTQVFNGLSEAEREKILKELLSVGLDKRDEDSTEEDLQEFGEMALITMFLQVYNEVYKDTAEPEEAVRRLAEDMLESAAAQEGPGMREAFDKFFVEFLGHKQLFHEVSLEDQIGLAKEIISASKMRKRQSDDEDTTILPSIGLEGTQLGNFIKDGKSSDHAKYLFGTLDKDQRNNLHNFVGEATICALSTPLSSSCLQSVDNALKKLRIPTSKHPYPANTYDPTLPNDDEEPPTAFQSHPENNWVPHTKPSKNYFQLISSPWLRHLRDLALTSPPLLTDPQAYVAGISHSLQSSWPSLSPATRDDILTVLAPCPNPAYHHCDEAPLDWESYPAKRRARRRGVASAGYDVADGGEEDLSAILGEAGTLDPLGMLGPQMGLEAGDADGFGEGGVLEVDEEEEAYGGELEEDSVGGVLGDIEGIGPLDPFGMLGPQVGGVWDEEEEEEVLRRGRFASAMERVTSAFQESDVVKGGLFSGSDSEIDLVSGEYIADEGDGLEGMLVGVDAIEGQDDEEELRDGSAQELDLESIVEIPESKFTDAIELSPAQLNEVWGLGDQWEIEE